MYNMYGAALDYSHPNLGYNLFSPTPAKQQLINEANQVTSDVQSQSERAFRLVGQ